MLYVDVFKAKVPSKDVEAFYEKIRHIIFGRKFTF